MTRPNQDPAGSPTLTAPSLENKLCGNFRDSEPSATPLALPRFPVLTPEVLTATAPVVAPMSTAVPIVFPSPAASALSTQCEDPTCPEPTDPDLPTPNTVPEDPTPEVDPMLHAAPVMDPTLHAAPEVDPTPLLACLLSSSLLTLLLSSSLLAHLTCSCLMFGLLDDLPTACLTGPGLGAVQVKLELGHRAQVRKKPTVEGFTHDWMVFVRGPEHSNIQHFVEKVVFHLHESFPKPKRVCKDPPYKVEESGYAGFILPIEVYFRNKTRDPHKRGSEESKVMVMQEGSTSLFSQHLKLPSLPNNSLTASSSDPKKSKSFYSSKDGSRGGGTALLTTATTTSTNSNSFSKLHKPSKDNKDKPPKDLKEPKSAFRDSDWEPSKVPKESSRKPKENQPLRDNNPKTGFKEPRSFSKEHRNEGLTQGSGLNKRLSSLDTDNLMAKKCKKVFLDSRTLTSGSDTQHLDKKLLKDRLQIGTSRLRLDGTEAERRKGSRLPPVQEPVDPNDTDMEDQSKSDSEQPSPASSSSSSGFAPTHHKRQVLGPLQSVMQELQSDEDDEDSEDNDDDMDTDADRPAHRDLSRSKEVSLSDGSESDSSSPSPPTRKEASSILKPANNQIFEVKSPIKQNKQDKNENMDCDKAYLDELVELHKRLMTLREGHILQQIVNLIEETGHFHITNTTFDFDLCSLDRSTVRKLQSYLDTSGLS
ncbi:protein AF-9 [Nematolebias whitei]|uniref:protein AF-9 n=1 Tax=Nematolebias whitei TaxID=451745 RepID=UPI001896D018|nr:protein AF-9 [Nematolebias whitei]